MKPIYKIITGISLILSLGASSQTLMDNWSYKTAQLMKPGKWECGILQPFRYGLTDKIELNTYAFLFPLMPNAGVTLAWGEKSGIQFVSKHELSLPSVFLNVISRKGTGGLLSPEFSFPFILGFNNTLLATKPVLGSHYLTLKAGLHLAIRSGEVDQLATMDFPMFYPRMAQYYKGASVRAGVSLKGPLCEKLFYEEGIEAFIVTRKENNFNLENVGSLMWRVGRSLRLKGGYNLSYGKYPFGNYWQLWPFVDLVFGSKL